jgi:hypothetical protein
MTLEVFVGVLAALWVRDLHLERVVHWYVATLRTYYAGYREDNRRYPTPRRIRHALWMQDHFPRVIRLLRA